MADRLSNPEKLCCISILVCDDVYRDEETKKLIIVGTFNTVWGREFPCAHPRMTVLFSLTNGMGSYRLKVRLEHEETGDRIIEAIGTGTFADPTAIFDVTIVLNGVVFTRPGKYWVCVEADGEILQQRPFIVQSSQKEPG